MEAKLDFFASDKYGTLGTLGTLPTLPSEKNRISTLMSPKSSKIKFNTKVTFINYLEASQMRKVLKKCKKQPINI